MEQGKEILSYLYDQNAIRTGPMHELGCLIGIDGDNWILQILQDDFYSQVLGGAHFTLRSRVTYQIKKLKEWNITPVFFFQGLYLHLDTSVIKTRCKIAKKTWNEISKGNSIGVEKVLSKHNSLSLESFREIIEIVRSNGGEVMKCPSHVGFQLNHLQKVLGGIIGGPELSIFGVKKIITELDYEIGAYKYFLVDDMIRVFNTTPKKFNTCCIAKGFWTAIKCTKISITDLLQQSKTKEIYEIVDVKNKPYIEKFYKLLESEIFLSSDEPKVCVKQGPISDSLVPSKNSEKFYFAFCFIPLSSELLTSFIKKVEIMPHPIADSLKYRTLVHKYKPIMKKIYSLLHQKFDENTNCRGIKVYYWYDEVQPFQLDFEPIKQLNFEALLPFIDKKSMENAIFDLQFCIKLHKKLWETDKAAISNLKTPSDPKNAILLNKDYLKIKVTLRLLESFGLISPQGNPTLFGNVLLLIKSEYQYQMFILLELIKLGLFDWKPMVTILVPETVLKKISVDKEDLIRLISRVSSLIPSSLTGDTWTTSIDKDLSQFYCLLRHISKTYKYLAEAFILEEFIESKIELTKENIIGIDACFDFYLSSVTVGILVKSFLHGKKIAELKKEFPQIVDLEGDLEKAWILWKEFQNVVKVLARPGDSIRDTITDATKLFKSELLIAGIHVI